MLKWSLETTKQTPRIRSEKPKKDLKNEESKPR